MQDNNRLTVLNKKLARKRLDALLVTGRENIFYLSGFSGSAGLMLASREETFFFTDARYTLQAKEEIKGARIKITNKPLVNLKQLIKKYNLTRLGFEADQLKVTSYNKLRSSLPGNTQLIATQNLVEKLRLVKDTEEIECIKRAVQIAVKAFNSIGKYIQPGISEKKLSAKLECELKLKGSEKTPFEIIVASGYRAAMPHGVASDKKLADGDLVVIDFGACAGGYNSDITRTVTLGKPSNQQKGIYQLVATAQAKAIEAIKPGVEAGKIDKIAREVIDKAGYGKYFKHSTGHGLGIEVHEPPRIYKTDKTVLEEGMVFTIEPGIYLPDIGGVRIEDMVSVTADGCQVLTSGLA